MSRWIVPLLLALPACSDDGGTAADESSTSAAGSSSSMGPGGSASSSADATAPTTSPGTGTTTGSDTGTTAPGDCVPASGDLVQEAVTLTAADGKSIAASVARPAVGTCLPALVLIHQFSNSKEQWAAHVPAMVEAGYVTIALDLRGHGESDPQDGAFDDILSDPNGAPLDVAAAYDALVQDPSVDASRIGSIGTSIGANLTVVAMTTGLGVAAIAPISPRLSAIENLAGNPASIDVGNIFCIAGETDGMGAQADTCTTLTQSATGDAQLEIITKSPAHGVAILELFPETIPGLLAWFDAVM